MRGRLSMSDAQQSVTDVDGNKYISVRKGAKLMLGRSKEIAR